MVWGRDGICPPELAAPPRLHSPLPRRNPAKKKHGVCVQQLNAMKLQVHTFVPGPDSLGVVVLLCLFF